MPNGLLLNTNGRMDDHVFQQYKYGCRMRALGHFLKAICDVAAINPDVRVVPACIMRADRDRQAATIPALQAELPELMMDDYTSENRIGSAFRLRCVNQLIGWNTKAVITT